jgi:predicted GTPase
MFSQRISEIVDPRPYAKGSLIKTFEKFPHLSNALPAMGYGEEQVRDLEATIHSVDCDTIVIGTPSDLSSVIDFGSKPTVIARYNLEVYPEHSEQFHKTLDSFFDRYTHHHAHTPDKAA